jgi:transcriptional regulator with XRE-family HTH domain
MSIRDEIAKNLRFYRKKRGLTQKEFAKLLGVNSSAVAHWELGHNSIDVDNLMLACDILDVSPAQIYGRDSIPKKLELTAEENQLLMMYRALDERGKTTVKNLLNWEYERQ